MHTIIMDILNKVFRLPMPSSFTIKTKHHLEDFDVKKYLVIDKNENIEGLTGWKNIDQLILETNKLIKECEELNNKIEEASRFQPIDPKYFKIK
ncbi:hypothetical protein [Schinkia azotoformans]|uniref:hypothetical protein n=1 Tax=Schinkia azotoformans TaxID=1454 RepID=UPI002DB7F04F|nr:hypothetical protein [Schinkia azotoformans]MEC1716492.1 hypothetical protein [Schinkia azotoformans]MEC1756244.1 hypothetical protein [Schinkia azotoformans]